MKIQASVMDNKLKTWLIMTLFVVFITTVVYVFVKSLGYSLSYVWIALFFSLIMSVGSYFYSDKIVLATSGAKRANKDGYPILFEVVEKLSKEDNLPMPRVYIIEDTSANAFATGRDSNHAVVAATTGILERLNRAELEGVIAHELSHVKNYDIRLMAIVSVLVGFVAMLSNLYTRSLWFGSSNRDEKNSLQNVFLVIGIILAILSPIIAMLIQLAVSRKRELLADASGALLTKYPEGLASALEKISKDPKSLKTANNATAHLYIVNPFKGKDASSWLTSLFMTHPPIEERIKLLRSM